MRDGITNIKNGKISVRRESGVLNDFWDQVCVMTTPRRGIEFTCEHDGVEFTVGELKVLIFLLSEGKEILVSIELSLEVKDTSRLLVKSYHSTNVFERLL